jgi:uncharacterized damage-inducible protein DinB
MDLSSSQHYTVEEACAIIQKPKGSKMPNQIPPPTPDEFAPFYADYVQRAAQRENVYAALSQQIDELHAALDSLSDVQACFKPGLGEWSIKEVIGHLNDVERIFSYRLLRVSRGDITPLPGFEQEDYVRAAGFDRYSLADLIGEFESLRRANMLAIGYMTEEALNCRGTASGYTVSARALVHLLVGHVDHHMASLQEKYLPVAATL